MTNIPNQPQQTQIDGQSPPTPLPSGEPDWAQGLSRDQILAIAQNYVSSGPPPQQTQSLSYAQPVQGTPSYPQAQAQMKIPPMPDANLLHTDPVEWQKQYDAYNSYVQQATLAQIALPFVYNQASLARSSSQQDSRWNQIWAKYGSEIEAEVRQIPIERHTKDLFDKACEIIKGRHVEELALEKAKTLYGTKAFTERAPGGSDMTPTLADPIDALFADPLNDSLPYVRMQKSAGITPQRIREYLWRRKMDPAKFVEQVKSGSVIYDSTRGTTLASHG